MDAPLDVDAIVWSEDGLHQFVASLIHQAVADALDPSYVRRAHHQCPIAFLSACHLWKDGAVDSRLAPSEVKHRGRRTRVLEDDDA